MNKIEKFSRRELSSAMMRKAPNNSEEFWAFHRAAHYYEMSECEGRCPEGHKSRMKAARAFKKGLGLRSARTET